MKKARPIFTHQQNLKDNINKQSHLKEEPFYYSS